MAAVEHRLTAVENPVLRTEAMMSAARAFWRSVDQAQIHRLACANNSPPPFSKRKPATDCVCDGDISPVTSKSRLINALPSSGVDAGCCDWWDFTSNFRVLRSGPHPASAADTAALS